MIDLFFGEYRFLSNFYPCEVEYNGIVFQSSEAAFQAQKTQDFELQMKFSSMNPSEAKHAGRKITLRNDWDIVKDNIMEEIVRAKFSQNEHLKEKLINTKDEYLIEGNTWGDMYWGVCNKKGKNRLGIILMKIRLELQNAT